MALHLQVTPNYSRIRVIINKIRIQSDRFNLFILILFTYQLDIFCLVKHLDLADE